MADPANLSAIGTAVRRRRLDLGLKQNEVPGVSPATMGKIENGIGPAPSDRIRVNLAKALRWQHDAYDVLAAGGTPAEQSGAFLGGLTATPRGETALTGSVTGTREDSIDYATVTADVPDHVAQTIEDLLIRHSASFRKAKGLE